MTTLDLGSPLQGSHAFVGSYLAVVWELHQHLRKWAYSGNTNAKKIHPQLVTWMSYRLHPESAQFERLAPRGTDTWVRSCGASWSFQTSFRNGSELTPWINHQTRSSKAEKRQSNTIVHSPSSLLSAMTLREACESFQALNHQGTPLLQSNSKSSHYGANDSTETLAKCHVDMTLAEGTGLDEVQEQRSLFTKSIECHSKTIETRTGLNVHIFPLLRHILTGGRCNKASLRLQNRGSVARDHLALERTFLAYTRTSLTVASAGVGKHQNSRAWSPE